MLKSILSVITRLLINWAGPEWQPEITEIRWRSHNVLPVFREKTESHLRFCLRLRDMFPICSVSSIIIDTNHCNFTSLLWLLLYLPWPVYYSNSSKMQNYFLLLLLLSGNLCLYNFEFYIFDGPVKLKNTAELKCLSKKPHTPGHPAEQYGITLHFWCTSHSQMPCC